MSRILRVVGAFKCESWSETARNNDDARGERAPAANAASRSPTATNNERVFARVSFHLLTSNVKMSAKTRTRLANKTILSAVSAALRDNPSWRRDFALVVDARRCPSGTCPLVACGASSEATSVVGARSPSSPLLEFTKLLPIGSYSQTFGLIAAC